MNKADLRDQASFTDTSEATEGEGTEGSTNKKLPPGKGFGIAKATLSEIFNISELQRFQDLFANAHGVASLITDPEGRPITQPTNFTRLCASIIRKTKKGCANCSHSDSVIGRYNPSGPVVRPCLSAGLWDAGVSINLAGKHIASWLIGQVRNEQVDEQKMMQYADTIGADRADFKAALNEVPVMSAVHFKKIADLLFVFANELSAKAYSNVKLKKQIDENKKIHTQLLEHEEELAESTERFKALHNASFGGIAIHDNGIILECNRGLSDMTGYSPEELMGMNGLLLIAPDYREMVMNNILTGHEKPYEAMGLSKNGEEFPIRLEARNIPYKGQNVRTVEFRDITESRNLEKAAIRQERLSAIGELASGVAHDFNNALQIIMGGVDLALKSKEPVKLKQYLKSIKNSARDAASRVRQLQRFAKKSQSKEESLPININNLAEDVIKEAKFLLNQFQEKGIHIAVESEYKAERYVDGNVGELRACLFNLIKNSAEAMPDGGKITISTYENENKVYLRVADTGTGMDKETQKKMFQPFYTTKGFEPGRGLGMSQVYSTIRDHNGEIYIKESKIGKGTIIEITLPFSNKQTILEKKEKDYAGSAKILWVDDEEMIRYMGKNMLEVLGHTADFAASGAEALDCFTKGKEYDLIITDLGMPEMSGWQLAEQIKNKKNHTKIAIVTGWGAEVSEEDKNRYNIGYVLVKPLALKDLQAMINEVIQIKKNK